MAIHCYEIYQRAYLCAVSERPKNHAHRDTGSGRKGGDNSDVVYSLDFQVTPHQLRHTYITNLIYSGTAPKTVQYLAGHQHSKITMDIYAKVKYNKPNQLSSVVNKAFAPKTSPAGNGSDNG